MSKLHGDILFNRALLWLLFGWEVSRYSENKWLAFAYILMAAYNFWKSYKVGRWSNERRNQEAS